MSCTNRTQKKIMVISAYLKKWAFSMMRNTKISRRPFKQRIDDGYIDIHKLLSRIKRAVKPPP